MKAFEISCTGYAIKADWYEGKSTNHILLILMGFTSSRQRQAIFTNYMVNATDVSALVIDYSGHGESPFELKDTRPSQHIIEVMYAFEWIKANYPNAKITVVGNSYGSFLAAHLSHYKNFENLVLRAPAIYRPEMLHDLWAVRFDDEEKYRQLITDYRHNEILLAKNPLFAIQNSQFQGRTLVVAHEKDEIIPRQTSDTYVKAFNADSFTAEGFSHAVSQSDITKQELEDYHRRIANWINVANEQSDTGRS